MGNRLKLKKLAKKIIENKGASISATMREVGYSESYSHNPQLLTKTKSWQQLVEELLPDELIVGQLKKLITADKAIVVNKSIQYVPDNDAQTRAIDISTKIKGKYAPQKLEVSALKNMTDEEILAASGITTKDEANTTTETSG